MFCIGYFFESVYGLVVDSFDFVDWTESAFSEFGERNEAGKRWNAHSICLCLNIIKCQVTEYY